jgi:hypothetical protein
MISERIHPDRTLPAGALPASLLRSGEYSIRGTFNLMGKSSLYWFIYRFADALEHGSRLQVYRSHMPEFFIPANGSLWLDAPLDCG